MRKELEKRIAYLKQELQNRKWEYERKGFKIEVEEKLEFLEKLYDALYYPI